MHMITAGLTALTFFGVAGISGAAFIRPTSPYYLGNYETGQICLMEVLLPESFAKVLRASPNPPRSPCSPSASSASASRAASIN